MSTRLEFDRFASTVSNQVLGGATYANAALDEWMTRIAQIIPWQRNTVQRFLREDYWKIERLPKAEKAVHATH